jgi:hypothetical protein
MDWMPSRAAAGVPLRCSLCDDRQSRQQHRAVLMRGLDCNHREGAGTTASAAVTSYVRPSGA